MAADTPSSPSVPSEPARSVVLHGVNWAFYDRMLEAVRESHTRITYFRGDMEILYPSDAQVREAIDRLIAEFRAARNNAPTDEAGPAPR